MAVVALVSAASPAPDAAEACSPPECVSVSHGFLMSPPVVAVAEAHALEWRSAAGRHWLVEGGTAGGCLGVALGPDAPAYRVGFAVADQRLLALHAPPDADPFAVPCAGAFEVGADTFVLRYACALHAREGGVGLVLVAGG